MQNSKISFGCLSASGKRHSYYVRGLGRESCCLESVSKDFLSFFFNLAGFFIVYILSVLSYSMKKPYAYFFF